MAMAVNGGVKRKGFSLLCGKSGRWSPFSRAKIHRIVRGLQRERRPFMRWMPPPTPPFAPHPHSLSVHSSVVGNKTFSLE